METEATQMGADDAVIAEIQKRMTIAEEGPQESPEEMTGEDPQTETEVEAEAEEVEAAEVEESTEDDAEEAVEEYELDAAAVASMLGVDEDAVVISDDGQVSLRTKIDGQPGQANLADLLKSYQLEGHVNKRSMELAEQRKAFEAERDSQVQAFSERLTVVDQLITQNEQSLLAEYQGINWAELEATDPGRYAAMQQKFAVKAQQIQQMKDQANQVLSNHRQELAQQNQAQHEQMLVKEQEAMLSANPAWADEATRTADFAAINEYAASKGFTPEEMGQIYDHRILAVLNDARKVNQIQSKAEIAKKRIKKVPKVLKPGAAKSKQQNQQARSDKLKKKARQSGSLDDVAAVIFDRI